MAPPAKHKQASIFESISSARQSTASGPEHPVTSTQVTQITSTQINEVLSDMDSDPADLMDADLINTAQLGLPKRLHTGPPAGPPPKRSRVSPPPAAPKPAALKSTSDSSKVLGQAPDANVAQLHEYIRLCEAKINLLMKCNAINDLTSLSLDSKKRWHATRYLPKLKALDHHMDAKRSGFTFLEPLPHPSDMSSLSAESSGLLREQPVPIDSSPVSTPRPHRRISVSSPQHSDIIDSSRREVPDSLPSTHETNMEEARRIIMERRAAGHMPRPPQHTLTQDDAEDDFGETYMGGLESSQVDDDDTDLSGFVARDDDDNDAESIDVTYSNTQPTQRDATAEDSDSDDISGTELDGQPILPDELDDIKLSQDVAERLGVHYDNGPALIELSDEDEKDDGTVDFTAQLNENRDEIVEIPSEDDLDDNDLNCLSGLSFIKSEYPSSRLHVISDDDFSDNDDELIQLSKTVATSSNQPEAVKRKIPGSEAFIDDVYDILHDTFKLPDFRPNQLEAIVSTLIGKDVFVLIPTGGGKSLCYQLPALVRSGRTKGTTIVISPLISLMQDQIQHLLAKNIRAGMISSKGTADERNETFRLLTSGQLDLVYLSPEMVNNSGRVQKVISKLDENEMLARVVVDEAHCVSSWGHDFRPDYKGMSIFKQQYPHVPIMALTATANEKVRLDIIHNLRMTDPVLLKQSFNRTNLFYEVKNKPGNIHEWVRDYVMQKQAGNTGIIYCHSKQSCETTSQKLNESGVNCMFYHAGMDPEERFDVQTKWQSNKIQLICATIAFGMGIDKPDVRFVIHMYIPRSLEGYYQETGRAGRDGQESECIMFYSYKDARALQSLIQRDDKLEESAREMHLSKLRHVVQYCENKTDCRRKQVLHFFNESFDEKLCNKKCDNCCSEIRSVTRDVTEHCLNIVKLVEEVQLSKVTVIHCQDIYKGSRNGKIMKMGHANGQYHGAGKALDRGDIERIFFHLQSEGALQEYQVMRGGFASTYVRLGPRAYAFKQGRVPVKLTFAETNSALSGAAKLHATGNGNGMGRHQFLESFVSAREVQLLEEHEKENLGYGARPERVVLPRQTFNGAVNDSNVASMEASYKELQGFRLQKLQELGFGRPNYFVSDALLKEMAIKLPTNARDFMKLNGATKEHSTLFPHFKKLLTTLAKERKRGPLSSQATGPLSHGERSPYFSSSQSRPGLLGKRDSHRKSHGGSQRTGHGSSQRKHGGGSKKAHLNVPRHVRQMPI